MLNDERGKLGDKGEEQRKTEKTADKGLPSGFRSLSVKMWVYVVRRCYFLVV